MNAPITALVLDTPFVFWVGGPLVISMILFGVLGRSWETLTETKGDQTLEASGLRSPISASLSVAGLAIPLSVALISYLRLEQSRPPDDWMRPAAALVLIGLSVVVGLWNIYSLATMATKEGRLIITSTKRTWFPAQLVSQLSLLGFGLAILAWGAVAGGSPSDVSEEAPGVSRVTLERNEVRVGTPRDSLLLRWGRPDSIQEIGPDSSRLVYAGPGVIRELVLVGDSIRRTTQTLRDES